MLRSMMTSAKNVCVLLIISAALTGCGAETNLAPLSGSVPIAQGSIASVDSSSVASEVSSLSSSKIALVNSSISSSSMAASNKSDTTSAISSSSVGYTTLSTSSNSFNAVTITDKVSDAASQAKTISSANALVASSKPNISSAQASSLKSSLASSLSSSSVASSKTSSSKSSSVSSSKASSSKASSSAISSAASSSTGLAVTATIQWSHPTARENGSYLNLDEIGGYQIRFKNINANDASYTYISIPGNLLTKYTLPMTVIKNIKFEIAVYDNKGLYSEFVPIN